MSNIDLIRSLRCKSKAFKCSHSEIIEEHIVKIFKCALEFRASDIVVSYNSIFSCYLIIGDKKKHLYTEKDETIAKFLYAKFQWVCSLRHGDNSPSSKLSSLSDDKYRFRVAQLPINETGCLITVRILYSDKLDTRNFKEDYVKNVLERTKYNGIQIISGSTGSRKSTFLASILESETLADQNIVSLEDPIEYELKNVNQVQIDCNITYSEGLKYILRHNPKIVLIGEVRDQQTAKVAIEASKSGISILTTTHASCRNAIEDRWINEFEITKSDFNNYVNTTSHHSIEDEELYVDYV